MAIDFELSEEQALVCQTVEEFAAAELRPKMHDHDEAGGVPESLRRTYAEIGLDRLSLPEANGGMNADDRLRALVNERLAHGDAGVARALQAWEPVVLAVQELASEEQAGALYGRIEKMTGKPSWGAVAFSEPLGEGLPDEGLATRAEAVDGGYRLHGKKAFVSQADGASMTVVFAQLADRPGWDNVRAFVVEGRPEGVTIAPMETRTGLLAAPIYSLELDGVHVAEADCLGGGDGWGLAMRRFFARAALQNAARCVGVMEAAWTYARDYATERVAFGKPIAHFQAIAFMLSDMATYTDASRWSVWEAAYRFDTEDKTALREALVAVANAYDYVKRVTEDTVQILGGAGFVEDYPAEKWMRDARTMSLEFMVGEGALGTLGHEIMRSTEGLALDELLPVPQAQPTFT